MDKLIYTAMTGAANLLSRQAAVSHNLANATSIGYRAEEHRLRAVQVQSLALPTRAFAVDASTQTDFTPGPMQQTDRTLDIALRGKGWIALQMPDGSEAYTRNGSLELTENGVLQTRNGMPVAADGGTISIPPDSEISVATDGTVSVVSRAGTPSQSNSVGRIKLVNPEEAQLVRGDDGLFRLGGGEQAEADPNVKIASGFLESSNVNVVEQMVSMISLARQFEMQTKMLSNAEANDRAATQILAR
jgi:flagellar basal-body rod protein FlgF